MYINIVSVVNNPVSAPSASTLEIRSIVAELEARAELSDLARTWAVRYGRRVAR